MRFRREGISSFRFGLQIASSLGLGLRSFGFRLWVEGCLVFMDQGYGLERKLSSSQGYGSGVLG